MAPRPPRLGAKPLPSSSFDRSAFSTPAQPYRIAAPPSQPQPISSYPTQPAAATQKPNYNISLAGLSAASSTTIVPLSSYTVPNYTSLTTAAPPRLMSSPALQSSPPMSSMMAPMQPTRAAAAAAKPVTKDDWGDFDPLR